MLKDELSSICRNLLINSPQGPVKEILSQEKNQEAINNLCLSKRVK